MLRVLTAIVCCCGCVLPAFANDETNWPRFRGPDGLGRSTDSSVPTTWDSDSVTWTVDLPVAGHSSPIVWGNRIFLTGTTADGADVDRHVICIDRTTQRVLWDKSVARGAGEKLHKMNSWATPSCATNGECVVAFFGAGGLHCFDFDGKPLWSKPLGAFPGDWGVGASPVIVDDMVIQNCDAAGDSYLLALDCRTGREIWKTPRATKPRGGWSTPVLIELADHRELLVNGEFGVRAYDPKSGRELWFCKGFNGRGTPCPVFAHGLVFVVNGKPGDVYAVRPGGRGDVTETHMVWHAPRGGGRDLPSPAVVGNTLVVIGMQGIATGYDALTGKPLWKARLGGNYSASPVVIGDLVYATAEDGTVVVFRTDNGFQLVARNKLTTPVGEAFRSSPAVSDGQLLLRSDRRLYCIGNRRSTRTAAATR